MASLLLLAIGILGPVALGQQTEWEQCGGLRKPSFSYACAEDVR